MVAGAEGCDAALFLGYHAKFGTEKSTFDHTYSGAAIRKLEVNGTEVSEFLLNAYALGEFNIPVILVAGEAQLLKDDVKRYAPWAKTVALKHSLSRVAARSPSIARIDKELRQNVKSASAVFNLEKAKPLTTQKPVKMKVTFNASHFADVAELVPTLKRTSGLEVEYASKNMKEAYKTFELLAIASSGMSTLLERLV
jgi:D-amino peptidase